MARIIPLFSFALEIVDGVTGGVPIEGEVAGFILNLPANEFSVSREFDEFSIFLVQLSVSGEVLDKVSILQETSNGDNLLTRKLFSFGNSIITSVQSSGRGGTGRLDQATFNFESISIN